MGKAAKKKLARRREDVRRRDDLKRADDDRLYAVMAGLGDPLSVVHALTTSPTGVHRYLSLSRAVGVALRATAITAEVDPADGGLAALLELISSDIAAMSSMEDSSLLDPRVPAVVRFGSQVYRLYPGGLERPVAAARRAELVSAVIDPTLVAHQGFGLADFVAACLTHSDDALARLSPTWPSDGTPSIASPPTVAAPEIGAATAIVEWLGLDDEHLNQHRASTAVRWATVDPRDLRAKRRQGPMDTCFGTAVGVNASDGRVLALPLPYLAEAWESAIGTLAALATTLDPAVAERWLRSARAETMRLLTRIRDIPPPLLADGPAGPVVLLRFGDRHLLVVSVAATTSSQFDATPAARAAVAVQPGATVRTPIGPLSVAADTEVVHLLVVAPAGATVIENRYRVAQLTLDDLARVCDTCEFADELFAFCRDLQRPPGGAQLLGWDAVDSWEVWRAQGQAFHQAGRAPDGIYIEPHQADGEWRTAADRAPVERALLRLGLPPVNALAALDVSGDKVVVLTDDMDLWHVMLLEDAVVASTHTRPVPDELRAVIFDVSGTLCWALLHVSDAAASAMRTLERDAIVARFHFVDDPQDAVEPLSLDGDDGAGTFDIAWTSALPQAEIADPGWTQRRLGELFIEALGRLASDGAGRQAVSELAAAWPSIPAVYALSTDVVRQRAQHLTRPRPAAAWARSAARRQFAEYLRETGTPQGLRRSDAAMRFETEIVTPWLMNAIRASLGRYDIEAVVNRAAAELEAVTAQRTRARQERRRHPHVWRAADVDDELSEQDNELANERATLAALLELALTTAGTGDSVPDDIEWNTMLSLASLYVDATIRSDALRWNIDGTATEITESYEVRRSAAGTPILDMTQFNDARRRHNRPPNPAAPSSPTAGAGDTAPETVDQGRPRHLQDVDPALADVDDAMLADLGCSIHLLLATCALLGEWPLSHQQSTIRMSRADLVDRIVDQLQVDAAQADAAVTALTLSGANLTIEGVQPWKGRARDHRLMTRPIIDTGDGTLIVLPWSSDMTGQILADYVSEGLLPWPPQRVDQLPTVRRALDRLRLLRTRELEDEVHQELQSLGLRIESRIKPTDPQRLGLASIPGEIDHVAALPDGDVIWVIEDKDLGEVYTPAEIARVVTNFHGPKGEVAKVLAKVAAVAADPDAVAAALRLDQRPRTVRGLIVTRAPAPAAYSPTPPVSFSTLQELARLLVPAPTQDQDMPTHDAASAGVQPDTR